MNSLAPERLGQEQLLVEMIDTPTELMALETAWRSLEARDPEATFFLSWDWLSEAFRQHPTRWRVLVVRQGTDEDSCIALMPLKYRLRWSETRNQFQSQIEAGGRLLFSEYTGFLCDPRSEQAAMWALAAALQAMPWTKLSLRYVAQKRRADLFCAAFETPGYTVSWKPYRINKGETDNLICPKVALPNRFDSYLSSIRANTRQQYRRFERKYLSQGDYHFTYSTPESFERDIAILMKFWMQKWAPLKGQSRARKEADNFEKVLRSAHALNTLFLPVLWQGDTPLGALGHIVDTQKGVIHFIIAGRDISAKEAFIGKALHFHSIECAIELGHSHYDFGHGDEPYKFTYGAERTQLHYFTILRDNAQADMVVDPLCAAAAIEKIERFIEGGKTDQARTACQQLAPSLR